MALAASLLNHQLRGTESGVSASVLIPITSDFSAFHEGALRFWALGKRASSLMRHPPALTLRAAN